jgi:hypothetical protein
MAAVRSSVARRERRASAAVRSGKRGAISEKAQRREKDLPAENDLRQAARVAQARRERGHGGAALVGERTLVVLLQRSAAQRGKSAPKQALVGSCATRDGRFRKRAPAASSPTPPRRGAAG